MFARATQFEIDTMRIDLDAALQRFKEMVLPELEKQPDFAGVLVMRTPEGNGLLLSLWATEEAAAAGFTSGFYDEQIAKFFAFYREPPGRRLYEVVYTEMPEPARPKG
jgi:heme-degrading monooxygenase HmoA